MKKATALVWIGIAGMVVGACAKQSAGPASLEVVPPSYYSQFPAQSGPRAGPINGRSKQQYEPKKREEQTAETKIEAPAVPPATEFGNEELLQWQAAYAAGLLEKAKKLNADMEKAWKK